MKSIILNRDDFKGDTFDYVVKNLGLETDTEEIHLEIEEKHIEVIAVSGAVHGI